MKIVATFEGKGPVFNTVNVTVVDGNGIQTDKVLHLSEFMAILENSTSGSSLLRIGVLPKGFYDGALSPEKGHYSMAIHVPSGIRPLNYYGQTYFVPFPSLMFVFKVTSGKVTLSNVYALGTDEPEEKSKVYHYPYGNVYDSGKICWGGNMLGQVPDKKDLDRVVSLFFGAETNDDLFRRISNRAQRDILEELKTKDTFPLEYLMPHSKYPLLEDVLSIVRV